MSDRDDEVIEIMARAMAGTDNENAVSVSRAVAALVYDSLRGRGLAVVPVAPTHGMLIEGAKATRDWFSESGVYQRSYAVWKAMLDAHTDTAPCTHEWVKADNKVVFNTDICRHCYAIRPRSAPDGDKT